MSKIIEQVRIELDEQLEEKLQWLAPGFGNYRILRKSIDARQEVPYWVYRVEVFAKNEAPKMETYAVAKVSKALPQRPVIVGAGPAGLFAALRLVERGIPCQLFEQGSSAAIRMRAIAEYWRYGKLNQKNNVCFGEGGAGLYSDGKLITRIKSPYIPYVLHRLVQFGAPEEIQYLSNPHVGSDRIRKVIAPLRAYLLSHGCEIHFDQKVDRIRFSHQKVSGIQLESGTTIDTQQVILATGHSAEDMLHHLAEEGVSLEGKSFAVGLRIEHPQSEINRMQYGKFANHPALGAANYRLTCHDEKSGVGVYSFCMCPGGYVIASGTDPGTIVSNGMSNYKRNSPYANSAIVISMDHKTQFGADTFAGVKFRKELEVRAHALVTAGGGSKQLPTQTVASFLTRKMKPLLPSSTPSGCIPTRLDELFDPSVYRRLCQALEKFNQTMPGFLSPHAQLFGVESRTSCPVRILRDSKTLQSVSHAGLYPTGEGAGYAGGITSAAVDGVKVAEALVESL